MRIIIDRILSGLEKTMQTLTAVLIGLLTLFVSWEAFARFVLHSGQFWSQEASLIAMSWIGLIGAAGAVWFGGHISLTLIVDRLPALGKRILRAFSDLVVAAFSFVLFLTGLTLVDATMDGTWSSIPIPIGYTNMIVPVTAAVMCLFSTVRFLRRILGLDDASAGEEG
ncbi:MAG TPA: TRAP transporter small permease [Spirochaetia bacterium]|nr:TRAP transporter small permease [Spirochaetia bacterium]